MGLLFACEFVIEKCNFLWNQYTKKPLVFTATTKLSFLLLSPLFYWVLSSFFPRLLLWENSVISSSAVCPTSPLPEAAQPLGQHGRASQVISNGAAAITGKHHHILGPVWRRRRTPGVQGRPAGGAEAAGAEILVTGRRLAATWNTHRLWIRRVKEQDTEEDSASHGVIAFATLELTGVMISWALKIMGHVRKVVYLRFILFFCYVPCGFSSFRPASKLHSRTYCTKIVTAWGGLASDVKRG